jgi:catechol 2,3-dioxygenase-like lactoylglutathione lyase family enzyme
MAGIVFLQTRDLARIRAFYLERIGMEPWVEQPGIDILRHGNLLVGFQAAETADIDSLLTFFYPTRAQVDAMHADLADLATSPPLENERYRIYNFFARDPDGRRIEFQTFLHPLPGRPDPAWS